MKLKACIPMFIILIMVTLFPVLGCKAGKNDERSVSPVAEKKTAEKEYIREPVVAGQFYEGDPKKLRGDIGKYLKAAPEIEIPGKIIGLMEPHAGYIYSAPAAAYGYKQLIGKKYKTVIVLAPSHRARFSGVSVIPSGKYRTPLGDVPIDAELAGEIMKANPQRIHFIPQAHESEHSLEVQVPFLQVVLGEDWKIVPIVYGSSDLETCKMVAGALAGHYDPEKHLIVASSDMSHYHPYEKACSLDKPALEKIEKLDLGGFIDLLKEGKAELCGVGPVATLMMFTRALGGEGKILKYSTSGDTAGDKSQVVGYGCAAFFVEPGASLKETGKEAGETSTEVGFDVTGEEKEMLLSMARKTLEEKLINGKEISFDQKSDLLDRKLGLFVTLRKGQEEALRGCIGHCFPYKKLREALPELALSAALGDPRFRPVRKEELKDINIEISLLSPMKLTRKWQDIKIPGHGVYVKRGFRSGVFLPQVADETGWDRETFMAHLCRDKAGLDPDIWKDPGTELYLFTVIKFEEEKK